VAGGAYIRGLRRAHRYRAMLGILGAGAPVPAFGGRADALGCGRRRLYRCGLCQPCDDARPAALAYYPRRHRHRYRRLFFRATFRRAENRADDQPVQDMGGAVWRHGGRGAGDRFRVAAAGFRPVGVRIETAFPCRCHCRASAGSACMRSGGLFDRIDGLLPVAIAAGLFAWAKMA
jgi:hypothetical protein